MHCHVHGSCRKLVFIFFLAALGCRAFSSDRHIQFSVEHAQVLSLESRTDRAGPETVSNSAETSFHTLSSSPNHIAIDPDNPPTSSDPRFGTRISTSEVWKTGYDRGVRLWKELRAAQQRFPATRVPRLVPTWKVRAGKPNFLLRNQKYCAPGRLFYDVDVMYEKSTSAPICSPEGYYWTVAETQQGIPPEMVNSDSFHYANWYSPHSQIIVAHMNRGLLEPKEDQQAGPDGPSLPPSQWYKAPHRWAEVTFQLWMCICAYENSAISSLSFIARAEVRNAATIQIAIDAIKNDGSVYDDPVRREYRTDTPDFYALLGSPNGVGVAKILTLFASQFATRAANSHNGFSKVKTITAVQIDLSSEQPQEFTMIFILEDIQPPPGLNSSRYLNLEPMMDRLRLAPPSIGVEMPSEMNSTSAHVQVTS